MGKKRNMANEQVTIRQMCQGFKNIVAYQVLREYVIRYFKEEY